MIRPTNSIGHSSEVQILLEVNEQSFDVGQIVPGRFFVRNPANVPPGQARLVISIDGVPEVKMVRLPNGIQATNHDVAFERIGDQ